MRIDEFIKQNKITQTGFAEIIGVTQGLVHQWIKGVTKITAERAVEIERKTNREIKREDLRPDLYDKEAA